jgi:hypothetical protein
MKNTDLEVHVAGLQNCKLLSDIVQCPTKFGKCPSKSNFDRTLVRSQKKLSHYTFFCCDKIRLQIHSICILRRITAGMAIHTCLVTYIYLVTYTIYVRPNLVVLVFVRPNSSYVRPKLEVIGQMSCQVKYLFAALYRVMF